MKKSIFISIIFSVIFSGLCMLLSGCENQNPEELKGNSTDETISMYNEIKSIDNMDISFAEDYKKYVIAEIDEETINDGVATINITSPDLIKAFDEAIINNIASNEELFREIVLNFDKYTLTEQISVSVEQNDGKWEIHSDSESEIEDYLMKTINDFLINYLMKIDFSDIEWEAAE